MPLEGLAGVTVHDTGPLSYLNVGATPTTRRPLMTNSTRSRSCRRRQDTSTRTHVMLGYLLEG